RRSQVGEVLPPPRYPPPRQARQVTAAPLGRPEPSAAAKILTKEAKASLCHHLLTGIQSAIIVSWRVDHRNCFSAFSCWGFLVSASKRNLIRPTQINGL